MKVLHVMPSVSRTFGGPVAALAGYLAASRDAGIEAEVAGPDDGSGASFDGSRVHLFPAAGTGGSFVRSAALATWLLRHGGGFDALHVHGLLNPISTQAIQLAVDARWPVVVRPFGTLSRYSAEHGRTVLKQLYFRSWGRATLDRVSVLHFTTSAESEEAEAGGLGQKPLRRVIPPPFQVSPLNRHVRSSANVLSLSRLSPVKRLEDLLFAWPLVLEKLPSAHLTIAGGGDHEYEAVLHKIRTDLGITSSVDFVGHVTGYAKEQLLADCDAFVLPSLHESFGLAVLEAIGSGVPVVVTREVQLAGLVENERLGLVSNRSPHALSKAIVSVLSDRALRRQVAARGPAVVEREFSLQRTGARLVAMYQDGVDRCATTPQTRSVGSLCFGAIARVLM